MKSSSSPRPAPFGCLLFFFLTFASVGIAGICIAVFSAAEEGASPRNLFVVLVVGGVFAVVGGGMAYAVVKGLQRAKDLAQKRAIHPEEPWRWRDDWASGRIDTTVPQSLYFYGLFGLAFSGAGTAVLFNMDDVLQDGSGGYVLLLVPLLGYSILVTAVRLALRWIKYGRAYCELVTQPGVLGGSFRAVVWVRADSVPEEISARLTCYQRCITEGVSTDPENRMARWQETLGVSSGEMAHQRNELLAIPVQFTIPGDCEPSSMGGVENPIFWELSVEGNMPGINLDIAFEVPVFDTGEATDERTEEGFGS